MTKDGNYISSKSIEELTERHECRVGKKKLIGKEILGIANTQLLAEHVRDKRPELALDYERVERSFIALKRALEKPFITRECRGIWI